MRCALDTERALLCAFRDEALQGRLVAQDEILDPQSAGQSIIAQSHRDLKLAAIHMFVEIEESEQVAGIIGREVELWRRRVGIRQLAGDRHIAKMTGDREGAQIVAVLDHMEIGP